ncbi:type II toxin-antitoxin system death-on-curing family toxin [Lysinibacillus sp. UGB7]|uniref:type II toxin-antitoxin system death-on-curing family toxin n=1 Tax=Lysinibacillus TaxID=400634 RepID=UPI0018CE8038|nr:type II toxin-antitoxin system death-on-curing family toxin [Lysinibacillus sphaericus]MBG9693199.1 hypothetical protein [Lysinibacillus sphaericus]
MKYLSYDVAVKINENLIDNYSNGEMKGVKEPKLLDSAIHRPFQSMFGESLYKDIFEKAVALFESIAKNHCFYNGNKRTAFVCMTYFLFINGHVCVLNEKVASNLTVDFVTGKVKFEEVVQIVRANSYHK